MDEQAQKQNLIRQIEERQQKQALIAEIEQRQGAASELRATGPSGFFETLDAYTNAPIRKTVSDLQDGKGPLEAFRGGLSQIGKSPATVPSGKEISARAGLSTRSLSDVVPGAFTSDPNFIPKSPLDLLKLKKGGLLDVSPAGVAGFGLEMIGPDTLLAGPALKGAGRVAKGAGNLASKVISHSGAIIGKVPEPAMQTLMRRFGAVEKIGKDIMPAVDEGLRVPAKAKLESAKKAYGSELDQALSKVAGQKADASSVVESLRKSRDSLNPERYPGAFSQIDELLRHAEKTASKENFNPKELHELKQYLDDFAQPGFTNEKIFSNAKGNIKKIADAAIGARRNARITLEGITPAEYKGANETFTKLHKMDRALNRSLLKEHATPAGIISAGSGKSPANEAMLRRLDQITGTNSLEKAQDIAAAAHFNSGRLRPTLVKAAVQTAQLPGRVLAGATQKIPESISNAVSQLVGAGKFTAESLAKLQPYLKTQEGQRLLEEILSGSQQLKSVAKDEENPLKRRQRGIE